MQILLQMLHQTDCTYFDVYQASACGMTYVLTNHNARYSSGDRTCTPVVLTVWMKNAYLVKLYLKG
jgi:hypothetical protein